MKWLEIVFVVFFLQLESSLHIAAENDWECSKGCYCSCTFTKSQSISAGPKPPAEAEVVNVSVLVFGYLISALHVIGAVYVVLIWPVRSSRLYFALDDTEGWDLIQQHRKEWFAMPKDELVFADSAQRKFERKEKQLNELFEKLDSGDFERENSCTNNMMEFDEASSGDDGSEGKGEMSDSVRRQDLTLASFSGPSNASLRPGKSVRWNSNTPTSVQPQSIHIAEDTLRLSPPTHSRDQTPQGHPEVPIHLRNDLVLPPSALSVSSPLLSSPPTNRSGSTSSLGLGSAVTHHDMNQWLTTKTRGKLKNVK
eukprot:PhF_6_TR4352/c0_g1_i1/m.5865